MTLSAIIIARNEEKNIKGCIQSLQVADEIIVIDNESHDVTAETAQSLGARVFTVPGLDFSYIRNVGREKAKGEWLFYIDADERVTKHLAKELKHALEHPDTRTAFTIRRDNHFFGRHWPKQETIVRVIKKDALIGWHGIVHETANVTGAIGHLESPLLHYTHNDLASMVEKTNEWSELESQLRYKNNHPSMTWWRFLRVMCTGFYRSYITDGGWKVGTIGLIESIYQSFSTFITYAKLWEKQNKAEIFRKTDL